MANRVLRDWTTSDKMDSLSPEAEVFFTRLIMKADDYGSFHAHPKLLNSALFPLKEYSSNQINIWVRECVDSKLIIKYTVKGKDYIRIEDFGQRLRNMRNTFPQPDDNPQQVAANDSDRPPETKRNETEVETESESARIDPRWLLEENLKNGLDEIYLDGQRPKWGHINFDFEVNTFKEKVRGSPDDYRTHDVNGIRKAFQYQLRNAKTKSNGITDKRQQQANSLVEGFAKRALDGDDGR